MKKYKFEIAVLKNKGIKSTDDVPINELIKIAKNYYNDHPNREVISQKINETLDFLNEKPDEYIERFLRKQILKDFIEEANELLKE